MHEVKQLTLLLLINVINKRYWQLKTIIKATHSGLRQFLGTEISSKMIKNAFNFTLKALVVLKMFNFFLEFLVMQKNDLIRKIRLISKFMTSETVKQTISIHILPILLKK